MTTEEKAVDDWYTGGTPPSEEQLCEEIAYYERKCAELTGKPHTQSRGALSLCQAHALHRKKLLAAIRDRRPEAWLEYARYSHCNPRMRFTAAASSCSRGMARLPAVHGSSMSSPCSSTSLRADRKPATRVAGSWALCLA